MKTIVLATNNKHKINEFKEILNDVKILTLSDVNFDQEIEENGNSFLENALIKAKTVYTYLKENNTPYPVISDDSGLCVYTLNNEPGIYSSRYAGIYAKDEDNRNKLLKELEDKKDRSAYFICCVVAYLSNNEYVHAEGKTEGYILKEESGDTSFGYDCLFYSNDLNKSFGNATNEEKNSVSHRKRAIENLIKKGVF